MWQAIGKDGQVSEPFVTKSSINSKIYAEEFIKKRLIPFINKYKSMGHDVIFWPDMATSHYAKTVTDLLKENSIDFVSKEKNGPNLPQVRPSRSFRLFVNKSTLNDLTLSKICQNFIKFGRNYHLKYQKIKKV